MTGYSPYEYLRVMRMKKAAEMLLTEDLTIAEVAYSVGINDPFYFSKCFKNQFGVFHLPIGKSCLKMKMNP